MTVTSTVAMGRERLRYKPTPFPSPREGLIITFLLRKLIKKGIIYQLNHLQKKRDLGEVIISETQVY